MILRQMFTRPHLEKHHIRWWAFQGQQAGLSYSLSPQNWALCLAHSSHSNNPLLLFWVVGIHTSHLAPFLILVSIIDYSLLSGLYLVCHPNQRYHKGRGCVWHPLYFHPAGLSHVSSWKQSWAHHSAWSHHTSDPSGEQKPAAPSMVPHIMWNIQFPNFFLSHMSGDRYTTSTLVTWMLTSKVGGGSGILFNV